MLVQTKLNKIYWKKVDQLLELITQYPFCKTYTNINHLFLPYFSNHAVVNSPFREEFTNLEEKKID